MRASEMGLGTLLAWGFGFRQTLASMLYGASPSDLWSHTSGLTAVALIAALAAVGGRAQRLETGEHLARDIERSEKRLEVGTAGVTRVSTSVPTTGFV